MTTTWLHKVITIAVLAAAWELVARLGVFPKLIFPAISDALVWIVSHRADVWSATLFTLQMLGIAIGISLLLAFSLATISVMSPRARASVDAIISVCNPIPGLALLPFAILWFGFTSNAVIFVVVYTNVWALTINISSGFSTIRRTLLEVGKNFGLSVPQYLLDILMPAALPSIISGLRISWALSWRSVVGVELVFGAVGQVLGLGATIYTQQFLLDAAGIMGILLVIAGIGLVMENVVLAVLAQRTVVRWGVQIAT